MYLCELCFDQYTSHSTDAWDGLPTAVCDACLAPPVRHAAWRTLWHPAAAAQIQASLREGAALWASLVAGYPPCIAARSRPPAAPPGWPLSAR